LENAKLLEWMYQTAPSQWAFTLHSILPEESQLQSETQHCAFNHLTSMTIMRHQLLQFIAIQNDFEENQYIFHPLTICVLNKVSESRYQQDASLIAIHAVPSPYFSNLF